MPSFSIGPDLVLCLCMDLAQIWQYLRQASFKPLLIVLTASHHEGEEIGRSMAFGEMPAGARWAASSREEGSYPSALRWLRTTTDVRYRGHIIRTCPVKEVDGLGWVASAVIFEKHRYKEEAVAVEVWLPRLQLTEETAQVRALELAKQWVDHKLRSRPSEQM